MKRQKRKSNPVRFDGQDVFIELKPGVEAVVDASDWPLISGSVWSLPKHKWCQYPSAGINGKKVRLHRILMAGVAMVDHIDGNPLNNRRCNLRPCTPSENKRNCVGWTKRGIPKGAYWHKRGKSWFSVIATSKERRWLGTFNTAAAAANAYLEAAKQEYGEFARGWNGQI